MKPTLHLLGIPHTLSFDSRYTHCAFTTKVNRFVPMMRSKGYDVVHYGNGAIDETLYVNRGGAAFNFGNVQIFSEGELEEQLGAYDPSSAKFVGGEVGCMSPLYREFNDRLARRLDENVEPNDIICIPFGYAHYEALQKSVAAKKAFLVETGIGYEDTMPNTFKIYESSAWMHYHCGKRKVSLNDNRGRDYEWVIPNYFDLTEWDLSVDPGEYVLYYGRIAQCKGLDIVSEIAKQRPDLKFVICGQGDATPWLVHPNIEYRAPVHGHERSTLLGKAIVVLCPSRYVEPFGGVAVEAMLCGRPVLASTFGAFEETLPVQKKGLCFRCQTLSQWLKALKWCEVSTPLFHTNIRFHAERFDMFKLADRYDRAFKQIWDLTRGGWYVID